jgi:hypothetical protein
MLGQTPVVSRLLSMSPPSWQQVFFHNLVSLAIFALAPMVAALATSKLALPVKLPRAEPALALIGLRRRPRATRRHEGELYRRCLLIAAAVAATIIVYFGQAVASLAVGWRVRPLTLMLPLATHHGVLEFMALVLPTAALLYCWPARRRPGLAPLLVGVLVIAVGLLFLAAHIEVHDTPQALQHAVMGGPPALGRGMA